MMADAFFLPAPPGLGVNCSRPMKPTLPFTATAVFFSLMVSPIHAGVIVLPNAQASTVGNDSSGSLAGSFPSFEFQDTWDKSQLTSAGGSLLITQLWFRLKPNTGSVNATATSFSLFMSTTTFTP